MPRTNHRENRVAPDVRDAPAPSRPAVGIRELYDEHGRELFAIACVIVGDPAEAEAITVHVLLEAGNRPSRRAAPRDLRRNLARRVYLRCTRARLGAARTAHDLPSSDHQPRHSSPLLARLSELSEQQRAAIALSRYGDHTYADTAALMALPAEVVATLLRSGLRELGLDQGPRTG